MNNPQLAGMERTVRLYPAYTLLFHAYAWTPIFILYFSQFLSLAEILRLEALYYASVVLLEVPSGYFSDRVGRRPTLLISTVAMAAAYAFFSIGGAYINFAIAQVLLAVGISFNSGTETSLHYDALQSLGRGDEYGRREARLARLSLLSGGIGCLAGGLLGYFSLRFGYVISLLTALGALFVAFRFAEPPSADEEEVEPFFSQLKSCLTHLREGALLWLFCFYILMTVLNHIPYELYQPYLDLLGAGVNLNKSMTAPIAGLVMATSTLIGAWVAGNSMNLCKRIGTAKTLLTATAMQTLVISTMAAILHLLVVPLLMLRSIPGALARAPMNAEVSPRVASRRRATYLSLQSLAGRLVFSLWLASLSLVVSNEGAADWPSLSRICTISAYLGLAGFLALAYYRDALVKGRRSEGK